MQQGSLINRKTKKQVIAISDRNENLEEIVIRDRRTNAANVKPIKLRIKGDQKDTVISMPCPIGAVNNRYEVIKDFWIHNSEAIMLPIILDSTWIAVNMGSEKLIALKDNNILWGRLYHHPGNDDTISLLYYCGGMHSHFSLAVIDTKADKVIVKKYDREPAVDDNTLCFDAVHYKYFAESIEYVPVCHNTIVIANKAYKIAV